MNALKKILVVDDEPVITKSCRRILADYGYEVTTTESGEDGLNQAIQKDFDLVITDLKIPDLDGMDLVRVLRRDRPRTMILVITGYGSASSAVEAMKLGVSDYLEKPFTPEDLAEAAEKALTAGSAAGEPEVGRIEASLVREVLRAASSDPSFGAQLAREGSRVLSGHALSDEAKAAIVSGDLAWIEKNCGELTPEERLWIDRRLQCEEW